MISSLLPGSFEVKSSFVDRDCKFGSTLMISLVSVTFTGDSTFVSFENGFLGVPFLGSNTGVGEVGKNVTVVSVLIVFEVLTMA